MFEGIVSGVRSKDTARVTITNSYLHPIYGKRVNKKSCLLVHDKLGVKVGDKVLVSSCRPISKMKRHIIKEIL